MKRIFFYATDMICDQAAPVAGARISLMTFNVWTENGTPAKWPDRSHALTQLLTHFLPDILCIQVSVPIRSHTHLLARPEFTQRAQHAGGAPNSPGGCVAGIAAARLHPRRRRRVLGDRREHLLAARPVREAPPRRARYRTARPPPASVGGVLSEGSPCCACPGRTHLPPLFPPPPPPRAAAGPQATKQRFLVATVHLPWVGNAAEVGEGRYYWFSKYTTGIFLNLPTSLCTRWARGAASDRG
jgi:hypothetical protein